jgi:hypothetical protein
MDVSRFIHASLVGDVWRSLAEGLATLAPHDLP